MDASQCSFAYEISLLEFDDATKACFVGIARFVDVVTIQQQACFEPQRVTGCKPSWRDSRRCLRALVRHRVEQARCIVPRTEDLETVFSGVSGARHLAIDVRQASAADRELRHER